MAVDLASQAFAAHESGIAEVLKLIQLPDDLERLPELIQEYEIKVKSNKLSLSNLVQSQIEAARRGLELLDKSHRHVLKLRSCLDTIHQLCEECARLIDHQDHIRLLSLTHGNITKVLAEIKDIIDLPDHAEEALDMLEDPNQLVPAFQVLTVLEGTAENARLAWERNAKAAKHDMSSLMQYLGRVNEAMAEFEEILWNHMQRYDELAQENPMLLVSCVRVIELQEQLDKQQARNKLEALKPKRYKQKLILIMTRCVEAKFRQLVELAPSCGTPNHKVRFNKEGDIVVDEKRDYLGNVTSITLVDRASGAEETIVDLDLLHRLEIIEEDIFDEDEFLNQIVPDLYAVEAALADAYDHVTPCFPPSYNIFETLFQLYHLHVAIVVDTVGQLAQHLTTRGSLRIMEFIRKYMETLRGLGLEEGLVKLPPPPGTNPDLPPGLDNLMICYIQRMEGNVSKWFLNILVVDLEYEPKSGPNGKLRTAGVTDFFRILNEEMEVILGIDDHGEVMFKTALMALRIMHAFQEEQTKVISDTDTQLSLEMFCALLNNNVECYEQSLKFVEEVQGHLLPAYRDKLEVEQTCRGFLEVAKVAAKRVVEVIFHDPGMSLQLRSLFDSPEWLAGKTMATLIATITDYMGDVQKYVEASFVKRVAEFALDELVRKCVNSFTAGIPPVTTAMANRLRMDEGVVATYFAQYVKPDKLVKPVQRLQEIRTIVSGDSVAEVMEAYRSILAVHSTFLPEIFEKIMDSREGVQGWERKDQIKLAKTQAKDLHLKNKMAQEAVVRAKEDAKKEANKRWFGLFG